MRRAYVQSQVTSPDASELGTLELSQRGTDVVVRLVKHDRTHPVVIFPLWMLTGIDLTLGCRGEWHVRSLGEAVRACMSRRSTGASGLWDHVSGH